MPSVPTVPEKKPLTEAEIPLAFLAFGLIFGTVISIPIFLIFSSIESTKTILFTFMVLVTLIQILLNRADAKTYNVLSPIINGLTITVTTFYFANMMEAGRISYESHPALGLVAGFLIWMAFKSVIEIYSLSKKKGILRSIISVVLNIITIIFYTYIDNLIWLYIK